MCLHLRYTKIEEYLDRWSGVSVHAAAKMLIRLGCGNNYMDWSYSAKCPDEVANSIWFENMRARDCGTFRFMGGPPKKRRLLRGTLLMLLVDRLLYDEAITNPGLLRC